MAVVVLMPPLCAACVHWWDADRRRRAGRVDRFCCDAYPNGIPARFIDGRDLHLGPVRGDGGMVWTPREPGE